MFWSLHLGLAWMGAYIQSLIVVKICGHCFLATTTHSKMPLLCVLGNFSNQHVLSVLKSTGALEFMNGSRRELKVSCKAATTPKFTGSKKCQHPNIGETHVFHFYLPWECCSFVIQWLTRWLKKNLYRIHVFSLEQKSRWKILRPENSRNVIFHYSIQLPSTQSWWGNNTNTTFLCLCIIPPVQRASLKLALSVISHFTNNFIFNFKGPVYCTTNLKLMFQASKPVE